MDTHWQKFLKLFGGIFRNKKVLSHPQLLYRGVSERQYILNGGRLIPHGENSAILMTRRDYANGLEMRRNGEFVRYQSEINTVRAHHLISGFSGGCFVSTSKNINVAINFATDNGRGDGFIYVLDRSKFANNGIVEMEFTNPRYPLENEISIRAKDNGEIPQNVIIEVRKVMAYECKVSTPSE